jgi:hypothetical protein
MSDLIRYNHNQSDVMAFMSTDPEGDWVMWRDLEEWLAERSIETGYVKIEEYRSLLSRLEKVEQVLLEIANDGCGMSAGKTCRQQHPDDRSDWCWCCMAREALEKAHE